MFLVLFVLHDPEKMEEILDAWEDSGVSGVTIFHSTGLGRARISSGWRDDLPLLPSLKNFIGHDESYSRTLFTVVPDEKSVDSVVAATHQVIRDLDKPGTGLLVVMPVIRAYGLDKK